MVCLGRYSFNTNIVPSHFYNPLNVRTFDRRLGGTCFNLIQNRGSRLFRNLNNLCQTTRRDTPDECISSTATRTDLIQCGIFQLFGNFYPSSA